MQQISNITQVRNNLSNFVSQVAREKKSVIIIRDSMPEAVLVPYEDYLKEEREKELLWQTRFDNLLKTGKKAFKTWAGKNKINLKKLKEEKMYEIVDKI